LVIGGQENIHSCIFGRSKMNSIVCIKARFFQLFRSKQNVFVRFDYLVGL